MILCKMIYTHTPNIVIQYTCADHRNWLREEDFHWIGKRTRLSWELYKRKRFPKNAADILAESISTFAFRMFKRECGNFQQQTNVVELNPKHLFLVPFCSIESSTHVFTRKGILEGDGGFQVRVFPPASLSFSWSSKFGGSDDDNYEELLDDVTNVMSTIRNLKRELMAWSHSLDDNSGWPLRKGRLCLCHSCGLKRVSLCRSTSKTSALENIK